MRGFILALVGSLGLTAAAAAQAGTAQGWAGFYRPSQPEPSRAAEAPVHSASVCLGQILAAQVRYGIPDNLLLAIGLQEAGRQIGGKLTVWPWTANSHGKGAFFGSKAALESWVRSKQATGTRSIDVGCMQINQKWHAGQFASLEEATDPAANVDYAARYLRGLYAETGDWWQAAGRYHSSTEQYKDLYLAKLAQNQQIAQKHQDRFRAEAQAGRSLAPTDSGPSTPLPGINWSADITGAGTLRQSGFVSIYSAAPLKALLPAYGEVN